MTYTSSQAFSGRGTKTVFNGVEVPEVRNIVFGWATATFSEYPRPQATVTMNYIWGDKVQARLLEGQNYGPHDLELELPFDRTVKFFGTYIDSSAVNVESNDVVSLTVVFQNGKVEYSEPYRNAEDSQEVDVIRQQLSIRDEEEKPIREMIARIVKSARIEQEILEFELWRSIFTGAYEDVGIEHPVGGGFTQVHDSHSYHYTDGSQAPAAEEQRKRWRNIARDIKES